MRGGDKKRCGAGPGNGVYCWLRVFLVVMMLMGGGIVWGAGKQELLSINVDPAGTTEPSFVKKIRVDIGDRLGFSEISLLYNKPMANIRYAFLKNGGIYYNLQEYEILNQETVKKLIDSTVTESAGSFSIPEKERKTLRTAPQNCFYYSSRLSDITALTSFDNGGPQKVFSRSGENALTVQFTYNFLNPDKEIQFVFVDTLNNFECFKYDLRIDFFKGEDALFQGISKINEDGLDTSDSFDYKNVSLEKKRLAFLYSFFKNPDQTNSSYKDDKIFKEMIVETFYPEIDVSDPFWNICDKIDDLKFYQDSFRRELMGHFKYKWEERRYKDESYNFPVMDIEETDFSYLYGKERNIYVAAYLFFCFRYNKPVFSYLYHEFLKDDKDPAQNIKFDYTQYKKLDEIITSYDGVEYTGNGILALMALRYLTWGVEYTPYPLGNTKRTNGSFRKVFDGGNINTDYRWKLLEEWYTDSVTNRKYNYLPYKPDKLSMNPDVLAKNVLKVQPKQVHLIEFDDSMSTQKIEIYGDMQKVNGTDDYKEISLARIDLWTSRNLAWDNGVIKRVFSNVSKVDSLFDNENDSNDKNDNTGISSLMDKRIVKGQNNNYQITRSDETRKKVENANKTKEYEYYDQDIEIGYEFIGKEKVAAMGIVRGHVDKEDYWGALSQYPSLEFARIELEIKEGEETKQVVLTGPALDEKEKDGSKEYGIFYEYISTPRKLDNDDCEFFVYGKGARYGGVGLYRDYFSRDENHDKGTVNSNVVYSYFVFDKEYLNVISVKLIDKTGQKTLNIAELMVFPENPLQFHEVVEKNNTVKKLRYWKDRDIYNNNQVFRNGDFSKPYIVSAGKNERKKFLIDMDVERKIRTIVLWETNADPAHVSGIFSSNVKILYGVFVENSGYLGLLENERESYYKSLEGLSSPFRNYWTDDALAGNPLPYAPYGIDSPRTFNYKMYEQWRARSWLDEEVYGGVFYPKEKTTRAQVDLFFEDYNRGYVSEIDVYKALPGGNSVSLLEDPNSGRYLENSYPEFPAVAIIKEVNPENPDQIVEKTVTLKSFLPGFFRESRSPFVLEADSLYHPDKSAGVDSLGILMGSLSMANLNRVYNIFNVSVSDVLDGYYQMNKNLTEVNGVSLTGMDSAGKPTFFTGNNSSTIDAPYRFSRSDLERSSIIVPDISFIKEGDLLVNYDIEGSPHLGIVIGFLKEPPKEVGTEAKEFMPNVLVLSVGRGFESVNVGTWGNPSGVFGGFSEHPEEYHVRRLLSFYYALPEPGKKDSWEMLDRIVGGMETDVILPEDSYVLHTLDNKPSNPKSFENDVRTINHWIPNTQRKYYINNTNGSVTETLTQFEYLAGIQIKFTLYDQNDVEIFPVPEEYRQVRLLPPEDMNFQLQKAKETVGDNIETNKGSGITFAALDLETAGLTPAPSGSSDPAPTPRTGIAYGGKIFDLVTFKRKTVFDENLTENASVCDVSRQLRWRKNCYCNFCEGKCAQGFVFLNRKKTKPQWLEPLRQRGWNALHYVMWVLHESVWPPRKPLFVFNIAMSR